jgi:hypothetical protein
MRRQNLAILLIVVVCISHIGGFSAVICHSSDGHVGIELVGSICCDNFDAGGGSPAASPDESFSSSECGCGPCVDRPITTEAIQVFKKTNPIKSTVAALSTISSSTIRGYDFPGYQLASRLFASFNPCLASLRTIILLT